MSSLEQAVTEGRARVRVKDGQDTIVPTTSWVAVDLEPFKRGERVIEPPGYLVRSDGRCLIYPGRPHVFYGESETLKSWAALLAARSFVSLGYPVLYVDFEGAEPSFVERCRHVGIPDEKIGADLRYVRPNEPLRELAREDWDAELARVARWGLVVLDGVTECYALHGWDINSATDAARFQAAFRVPGGAASIAIDHTSKDAGRGVIGSQHKRAGLDGAEYEFRPRVRGGRGGTSVAALFVTKDRHGYVREWAAGDGSVGLFTVAPDGVLFDPLPITELVDPQDEAVERVHAWLLANPGSSARAIAGGVNLRQGRTADALSALEVQQRVINEGTRNRPSWRAL
jgi:hypothetical protein